MANHNNFLNILATGFEYKRQTAVQRSIELRCRIKQNKNNIKYLIFYIKISNQNVKFNWTLIRKNKEIFTFH